MHLLLARNISLPVLVFPGIYLNRLNMLSFVGQYLQVEAFTNSPGNCRQCLIFLLQLLSILAHSIVSNVCFCILFLLSPKIYPQETVELL